MDLSQFRLYKLMLAFVMYLSKLFRSLVKFTLYITYILLILFGNYLMFFCLLSGIYIFVTHMHANYCTSTSLVSDQKVWQSCSKIQILIDNFRNVLYILLNPVVLKSSPTYVQFNECISKATSALHHMI